MARLLLAGVLLALLAAGCGGGGSGSADAPPAAEPPPTQTGAPAPAETEPAAARLTVYFLRDERIGAASRSVEATEQVGRAALEQLLDGPTGPERDAGLSSAVPEGTRLLDLAIADGVATVDLSREFESGGGSLSLRARVAQVVYTLTQFPTVDAVSFRLEGEPVEALGGEGLLLEEPAGRADFEELTPQILVESPAVGDPVASPLRLRGTANTFEATFELILSDADGRILVEDFVTATSGSGVRGTFDASFPFELERAGGGTLVVFERSAADGSRLHVVEIPVELTGG